MRLRPVLLVLAALAAAAALAQGCASLGGSLPAERGTAVAGRTPVVFVSGVTGTKLRDPTSGSLIWGGTKQLFGPRDGGYRLALPLVAAAGQAQVHYEAIAPLLRIRLPFWSKEIYRPLLQHFEVAGYRRGDLAAARPADDFFFFNYDWRHGNLESVRRLHLQLQALSRARGGSEVDLICQSNAAKICRWLAKYGVLDLDRAEAGDESERGYRLRKLVLVGASNSGALRVLQLLNDGRSYIPLVGRRFHPETFFSLRPLFEDLPAMRDDLFFDAEGKTLPVDLFEATNWAKYGWSIFAQPALDRLRRNPRSDLFGDHADRLDYLERKLTQARRLQRLLAGDSLHFPAVRYYLLENTSSPTVDRALLTQDGGSWRTYFLGDKRVDRNPALRGLATALGDGHATLASQRGLSPQETAALAATATATGGHFEAVIQPAALDAVLGFLAEP